MAAAPGLASGPLPISSSHQSFNLKQSAEARQSIPRRLCRIFPINLSSSPSPGGAEIGRSLVGLRKRAGSSAGCSVRERFLRTAKMTLPNGVVKAAAEQEGDVAMGDTAPELITEFMVDMKCDGCVKNVRNKLEPLADVSRVDVDLANQVVRVLASASLSTLEEAIKKSGLKSRLIGQGNPAELALTAAVAEFKGPTIFGVVRFAQVSQELMRVEAAIDGLGAGQTHGWTVNSYGNLTDGAASTGGHYDPTGAATHGRGEEGHAGDLGNLEANGAGSAAYLGSSRRLKVWDLIGRAVVIYEHADDFGQGGTDESRLHGSMGAGIAAAVIARSAGVGENYKSLCTCDGTVIWEATPDDYVKTATPAQTTAAS
eukprot:TRINITY_DN3896_c0_g1_i1.p1 TRINITY_DN3896_c0_g1~~TRINITY_DN3896_c0_g1_i1.p1  ORF type:complete len:371 (+),score=53.01 TRINITY_DN3896_c0_g1_i1:46-1158(+)